jgi:hypothetical protein
MFAVIVSQNEDGIYFRQEDDEDEAAVTANPNVLPQVAQILGAIFSGTLNLTRIVDSTVGLVPNLVRNQVQGLVKLITGENINLTASSTPLITEENEDFTSTVKTVETVVVEAEDPVTTAAAPTVASIPEVTTKGRYKVNRTRSRPPTTTLSSLATNSGDDELVKLERELKSLGELMVPESRGKEPRIYAGLFNTILSNMNMTEVAKAVPTIFKGATQAFTMLENLGVLDQLPGGDMLSILDTDKDE